MSTESQFSQIKRVPPESWSTCSNRYVASPAKQRCRNVIAISEHNSATTTTSKKKTTERNLPAARRCAVLAKSAAAELARKERRTGRADDLSAVVALVHLVASAAVEGVAPVANPDFVVGLELVAPVAPVADRRAALVAPDLDVVPVHDRRLAVEAGGAGPAVASGASTNSVATAATDIVVVVVR